MPEILEGASKQLTRQAREMETMVVFIFVSLCFSETLKHCQQSSGCGPEERDLVLRLDPESCFMFRATLVAIASVT